jgi:predicted PurR-regulated permease PerM
MMLFILFFVLLLIFLVPMLTREAKGIAGIDYDELSRNLSYLLDHVQDFLYNNNLMDKHETLVGLVTTEIRNFANLTNFSSILGGVVSATGSFLMGLFAIFFLSFFFMKDDIRFDQLAQPLIGEQHAVRLNAVSEKINRLLSRYFIGLLIEIASMITLLYIGMAIFGVKSALLMAFFGGLLNAIPYLGPLIGVICSCLFGAVNCLSINDYQAILPTTLEIAGAFLVANLIDNLVLQPIIYSKSVKAHPVEIFLVIIMGGSFAGIMGMLFAIPVYTMLRTIVIELFNYVNAK